MTTATATKRATRTREQDFEEQISRHHMQLAKLNEALGGFEAAQLKAEARIQDLIDGSFDRPLEGFAEDVDAARNAAADAKARAEVARRRIDSYRKQSAVSSLEAELSRLQQERREAEVRAAAQAQHEKNLAEYYLRVELRDVLGELKTSNFNLARNLINAITASARQHGFNTPAGFDQALFDGTGRFRPPSAGPALRQRLERAMAEIVAEAMPIGRI